MPEFKNKEEYEKWKTERIKENQTYKEKQEEEIKKKENERRIKEEEDRLKFETTKNNVTLINCPTCSNEISVNASACPKCGEPLTEQSKNTAIEKVAKEGLQPKECKVSDVREYKIVSIWANLILTNTGMFDASSIENVLNEHAPEGWYLSEIVNTDITSRQVMLIILERDK
jgi:Domain of unknown function (DUF4177)